MGQSIWSENAAAISHCFLAVDPSDVFNSAFYFPYQSLPAIVK